MLFRKNRNIILIGMVVLCTAFALSAQEEGIKPEGIERLKNRIDRLVQGVEGTVGVAIKHCESGQELAINGGVHFPMASVFKIPVLVEVMAQVKEGHFALEDEVRIQKPDQHLGSGILSKLDAPGIALSIQNFVNLMMMESDNSATDILVAKVGVENINKRLKSFGIDQITVDRNCQDLILEAIGLDPAKFKSMSLEEVTKTSRKELAANPQAFEEATKKFSQVAKDQSTPQAMNALIEKILKKEILDEVSCEYIISVMLKCQTGERRIKGNLPSDVKVAHKTGTIGGTVNDVGVIYLSDGLGHVIITVFTKDMKDKTKEVEDLIAKIARLAFDYFYFTAE